jgi:hypothetical protein
MNCPRRDLGQGDQYERPPDHLAVRNRQLWRFDGAVTVQENVYINHARPPAEGRPPAHFLLDGFHGSKEIMREEVTFGGHSEVQKRWLIRHSHGGRFVKRRDGNHVHGVREEREGSAQILLPVT